MERFNVKKDDGSTKMSGKITYDDDGSLKRMDAFSSFNGSDHVHEWVKKREDGTYEYGCHDRDRKNTIISEQ